IGLTPAIFVAMLDQFSDNDLTIQTPTLEELGLLKHEPIKQRWLEAIQKQEDQRARNIAKNIRDRELVGKLQASADAAVTQDEAGEEGGLFAQNLKLFGYVPSAIAHIVNVAPGSQRGNTVRRAAEELGVPYTEVNVAQFTDVYQVQRTLKAVLEAQPYREKGSMIEKIMQTELLVSPY